MLTVFYNHITEAMRQEGMSLEEVAAVIKEHGITGVEMDYRDLNPTGKHFDTELPAKLRQLGIPIYGVYVFYDWGNHPFDSSYKRIYRELKSIGVHNSLAIPGMIPDGADRNKDRNKYAARMIRALRRAVKCAGKNGIRVLLEDFDDASAPYSTAQGMQEFFRAIPDLKCAFDTGNFYYSGEDAIEALSFFAEKIEYVHLKDRSLEPAAGEEAKASINGVAMYSSYVGGGVIPIRELICALTEAGYTGDYAIEHFGSLHQLRDMIASADFIRSCLAEDCL